VTNVSIIVLTLNEELNITQCLESVSDLSDDIFVVDSGSIDRTLELARKWTSNFVVHEFQGYAAQRNWALRNLPFRYE
jgi:glycosyltransferase involved in cell wall biosynthesis